MGAPHEPSCIAATRSDYEEACIRQRQRAISEVIQTVEGGGLATPAHCEGAAAEAAAALSGGPDMQRADAETCRPYYEAHGIVWRGRSGLSEVRSNH